MLQGWQVERESTVYRGALAYNDIWLKKNYLVLHTYKKSMFEDIYITFILTSILSI